MFWLVAFIAVIIQHITKDIYVKGMHKNVKTRNKKNNSCLISVFFAIKLFFYYKCCWALIFTKGLRDAYVFCILYSF